MIMTSPLFPKTARDDHTGPLSGCRVTYDSPKVFGASDHRAKLQVNFASPDVPPSICSYWFCMPPFNAIFKIRSTRSIYSSYL